jgi:hypothetical protein
MKIAALDSGFHQRQAFMIPEFKIEMIPTNRLNKGTLFLYDVIIIPSFTDQFTLNDISDAIIKFVHYGGVVVILGATDINSLKWLPYCKWGGNAKWPTECNISSYISEKNKPIIEGITDFKYHTSYTGHGTLLFDYTDENFNTLLEADDDVIMFVRSKPNEGPLLVTTLDPDYHSIPQTPGPSEEVTSQTQKKATQLLLNILKWAELQKSGSSHLRRKFFGIRYYFGPSLMYILVLSLPPVILILKPSFKDLFFLFIPAMVTWVTVAKLVKPKWKFL